MREGLRDNFVADLGIGLHLPSFAKSDLLVIFGDYIGRAYDTTLWPLLGFFFMPYTTLAYAFGKNANGSIEGLYLVLVIVAVLFDFGSIGGGGRQSVVVTQRRRTRR